MENKELQDFFNEDNESQLNIKEKIENMTKSIKEKTFKIDYSLFLNNSEYLPSPSTLMAPLANMMYGAINSSGAAMAINKGIQEKDQDLIKLLKEYEVYDPYNFPLEMAKKLTNNQKASIFLNRYGKRGKIIHNYIENFLLHSKTELKEELSKEFIPNFKATQKFLRENDLEVIATELRLWDKKYNTTGICDFIGYINGKLVIADWKTNNKIKTNYIALQLVYYQMMLRSHNIIIEDLLIVHLKGNGEYDIIKVDDNMKQEYEKTCISLNNINKYYNMFIK